jgi:NADH-quinone oxidoreductase subunit J
MLFSQIMILLLLSVSFVALVEFQNPFSSLLSLAIYFILNVALLVNVGVEFLALTLVVIYLGAILILFLFIAMTIDLRLKYLYAPEKITSVFLIYFFITYLLAGYVTNAEKLEIRFFFYKDIAGFTELLYTEQAALFMGIAFTLLLTMLATIGLTIKDVEKSRLFIRRLEKQVC